MINNTDMIFDYKDDEEYEEDFNNAFSSWHMTFKMAQKYSEQNNLEEIFKQLDEDFSRYGSLYA